MGRPDDRRPPSVDRHRRYHLGIVGGPQRGLQVNSSSPTAINWIASGSINLSGGGPLNTGSDVAIVGDFQPSFYGFNKGKKDVKPSNLQ